MREPHHEHRQLGQHAVEPDADPAEAGLRLLARRMQLGDRHDRPAGLELAAHAAGVGAHGRLGDAGAAFVGEALPDPPRGVALLAGRAQVGDQPRADRRAMRTEPRRRLRDRLARRRQRRPQRLPHRAPVHAVAVRQATDGHAILAPVSSDMLKQLCVLKTKGWERDDVTNPETCSSSPAGASPVRVIARKPGSRSAARAGNGPGRSPMSKALQGERPHGPQHEAKFAASFEYRSRDGNKEEPSPELQGEGHGRGEAPGCAASKNLPA